MEPGGKVFLKSEWGQIGDDWPCVSFTKKSVGARLTADFKPGRDVLVYVGTTNAEMTEDPAHRGRLISAVVIEPNQVISTGNIVPPEVWRRKLARWGNRWPFSMAVLRAANLLGPPYPDAHDVIPSAYRSFALLRNRGGVVLAEGAEREQVMDLDIAEVTLRLRGDVTRYVEDRKDALTTALDDSVKGEIGRMAQRIIERVQCGGERNVRINPQRFAPNISDLVPMLTRKWQAQEGRCALCDGLLVTRSTNRMLQPSADRKDSGDGAYSEDNVQITHLACNLGKNEYGLPDFLEWLNVVRGMED
ncbi:hypothetical protein Sp245p_31325 (plasmid) [Azospirillum baldaniorum]|uniref:Uncharacterized protein n=2 Tax=Azospirillum baldaniorum TaxID=1064539 RepID=A0A9P1K1M4_9PROT|nr:hypothetical protein Sp245p_31325 [Azospirillum baldaniorum]CCD03876.1 protein of unknown function [Azospirillum baldaniorum]